MNDLYGYKTLCEAVYTQLCRHELRFRKTVSPASFSYYCDLALWRRLFYIHYAQGDDEGNIFLQVDEKVGSVPLPKPISQFHACLGDFTDANQRK